VRGDSLSWPGGGPGFGDRRDQNGQNWALLAAQLSAPGADLQVLHGCLIIHNYYYFIIFGGTGV
jgi:hypothetical protein